ncbi:hypothetical protein [Culicoidibacter larvae]|uniref:Uncharacterized protein n=1 Tax=Culicoidibacter larvae TaxID=2579976 RepID=A0A5R8Q7S3_9FIRM|nr:hypothetical protein [Culicoidibacter larvae]TLG71155.1 hypothetical protein FEZ08_11415 [Culicoidibacter larvae]
MQKIINQFKEYWEDELISSVDEESIWWSPTLQLGISGEFEDGVRGNDHNNLINYIKRAFPHEDPLQFIHNELNFYRIVPETKQILKSEQQTSIHLVSGFNIVDYQSFNTSRLEKQDELIEENNNQQLLKPTIHSDDFGNEYHAYQFTLDEGISIETRLQLFENSYAELAFTINNAYTEYVSIDNFYDFQTAVGDTTKKILQSIIREQLAANPELISKRDGYFGLATEQILDYEAQLLTERFADELSSVVIVRNEYTYERYFVEYDVLETSGTTSGNVDVVVAPTQNPAVIVKEYMSKLGIDYQITGLFKYRNNDLSEVEETNLLSDYSSEFLSDVAVFKMTKHEDHTNIKLKYGDLYLSNILATLDNNKLSLEFPKGVAGQPLYCMDMKTCKAITKALTPYVQQLEVGETKYDINLPVPFDHKMTLLGCDEPVGLHQSVKFTYGGVHFSHAMLRENKESKPEIVFMQPSITITKGVYNAVGLHDTRKDEIAESLSKLTKSFSDKSIQSIDFKTNQIDTQKRTFTDKLKNVLEM